MPSQVIVSLAFLKVSVAAAGTALLLGAAAMLHQQDLAAASAPFDSHIAASGDTLAQDRPSEEPRTIEIVAKRFTFEPARVEVKEGERIRLVLTSADGVHGIEIKKFKVNKKIPRGGEPVTIEFVANAPGQFPILCSEFCGNDHDDMKGMLVVEAKAPDKRD
jgi:cytochrome c oxidase subunit 2